MVFAPTRDISVNPHEPATAPKRPEHVQAPVQPDDDSAKLKWRAVVHTDGRDTVQTTWHIAGCAGTSDAAAHCREGQRLIESVGDPDGHCLIEGACARCSAASVQH